MSTQKVVKDYQRLFRILDVPYFVSEVFFDYYKNLNCFLLFYRNDWISYIPLSTTNRILNEGVSLYSNNTKFNSYQNDFDNFQKKLKASFKDLSVKKDINKNELKSFFYQITKFFSYYSKTEFIYTDKAFLKSATDKNLADNLRKLEKIKNSGRLYLNKIFSSQDSYLSHILKMLGEQFKISEELLWWYSVDEILNLFNGHDVPQEIITKRKKNYLMMSDKNEVLTTDGDEALELIEKFLGNKKAPQNGVSGTTANPGQVRARAYVIDYGYENFGSFEKMVQEMKKGDVLITETTSPELILACKKASAIITDQGGLMSHAAIVSRELNIPCIVGTGNATNVIETGDILEADADEGRVVIIKFKKEGSS